MRCWKGIELIKSTVAASLPRPLTAMRVVQTALLGLLPHGHLKRTLLRRMLGWDIDPSAYVGVSLFLGVRFVRLGADAHLVGFSAFHDVEHLELAEHASIGRWNWVTAASALRTPALNAKDGILPARLVLRDSAALTSRHYVDCSGGVDIGAFSVIAGVRSTVLTHQVDTASSEQDVLPVRVGAYCFVGSNVKIVPGARIPDRCLIGMGSVVVADLDGPGMLYAGVPARMVKPVDTGAYFSRNTAVAKIPQAFSGKVES